VSADRFVGAWRLISFEHISADGHATYPFGRQPRGFLIYTADGYMSTTMAAEGYQGLSGGALDPVSEQEAAVATGLYISFAGRYSVTETHVVHHIEICLRHNWVGDPVVREYAFAGNRLTLSTRGLALVWEQAGSPS
jgi:Lipocalin-like domain